MTYIIFDCKEQYDKKHTISEYLTKELGGYPILDVQLFFRPNILFCYFL